MQFVGGVMLLQRNYTAGRITELPNIGMHLMPFLHVERKGLPGLKSGITMRASKGGCADSYGLASIMRAPAFNALKHFRNAAR